ncbi:AAA family ATPase [Gordonia sp. (in: high G+C Gram-positive bacteria)]|uniref:AAA family ATPase n=1 Tax=Gordonia sp. (in: high G+C Gram-positive bacteria) TaxID=84139 RepID=UPI003526CB26
MTIPYGRDYDENGFPIGSTTDTTTPTPSQGSPLLAGMFNGEWLDNEKFPKLEEVVPGVLVEGLSILVGPPKVGKSWLVGNLAVACASGGKALGSIGVVQRAVLYAALEDGPRRLQHRLRHITEGEPLPPGLDMICSVEPGMVEATIAEWLLVHKDDPVPPLVILDTLGKARPQRRPGDDPYLADYKVGSQLKKLVDDIPGSALLVVHHTNKGDSGDFVDAVSGTQGIAGSADSVLVLRRPRKSNDATLAITGRDVTEREIALVTDNGRWKLDGFTVESAEQVVEIRKEQGQQGDKALDILAFAREHSTITPKVVADHFHIDARTASTYLGRLVDREHLFKAGYGKYTSTPTATATEGQVK